MTLPIHRALLDQAGLAHPGQMAPCVVQGAGHRTLQFDLTAIQSRMALKDPLHLVLSYTRSMLAFRLFVPDPGQVVMVGLGGGSLAKYCYHALPGTATTVCEIDARVIALRDQFHVPPDDERFQVVCADGADYLRRRHADVDVLLVDGFDSRGIHPSLCTEAFYRGCLDCLTPNGVAVFNLLGTDDNAGIYIHRLCKAFADQVVVIRAEDSANYIVLASPSGQLRQTPDEVVLAQGALLETVTGYQFGQYARRLIVNRQLYAQAEQVVEAFDAQRRRRGA
ncbi:hypothetical protein GCM10007860_02010 [Chitiniphilus shinanonensis]|uniref:Spermidine synthase n=1 Tax=Chitiniphilus shinanonensis TaxID=553088 RepID=A0ABQ6BM90_9NEIS|nr:hypothetical protein [Chitiniphilus shinanonensis]GLS03058.1 hypothetical protein GCM10007860_02010 [Chitiniphilus shinanonensis]